jgi:hypothetical protein
MVTIFSLLAELERDLLLKPTRMSLARARAAGKKLGRPKGSSVGIRVKATCLRKPMSLPVSDKGSKLRLTHEQSIFSYFNISYDFLSLFLNFYAPLNLDQLTTRVKRRLDPILTPFDPIPSPSEVVLETNAARVPAKKMSGLTF